MAQDTCSIGDCQKPAHTRGWCTKHYKRWLMHGDPLRKRECRSCGSPPTNPVGHPYCDPCRIEARRDWQRAANLRRYGVTVAEYERLIKVQRGRCAICRTTDPGGGHVSFAIDHDHISGHVRGLLCRNCNSAIGMLQDDPDIIAAAAAYVRRTRQMPLFND